MASYALPKGRSADLGGLHFRLWMVCPNNCKKDSSEIIDGFHRWVCAQTDKRILKRDKNLVPVIFEDVDKIDAMLMHIRLNREACGQLYCLLYVKYCS
jgi:hypothetical protein